MNHTLEAQSYPQHGLARYFLDDGKIVVIETGLQRDPQTVAIWRDLMLEVVLQWDATVPLASLHLMKKPNLIPPEGRRVIFEVVKQRQQDLTFYTATISPSHFISRIISQIYSNRVLRDAQFEGIFFSEKARGLAWLRKKLAHHSS